MAEQALLHGGNRGGFAFGHVPVAEFALDSHATLCRQASVDRVGEGDGLRRRVAQAEGRVGKPGDEKDYDYKAYDNRYYQPHTTQD